jgi:hypothetical protein
VLFKGPSDLAVEEVHAILRQIVARTLESEDCKALAQYGQLKREIATCASLALEKMKARRRARAPAPPGSAWLLLSGAISVTKTA